MREYELVIDEALKVGLSPFKTTPFNSQLLQECLGFRLGKAGLEKYEVKTNPLESVVSLSYSWPFPQVITGEKYNFLIVRDSITNHEDIVYSISDDGSVADFVFAVDALTFGKGTLMEVADFGKYAIMMNGVVMIYWNVAGAWNASLDTDKVPLMTTICNFKGQVVGGGVKTRWYDCDDTFYCWSKIGDLDFTPDEYNLAGYKRDPFGGIVYHVRRLKDHVVGYSSKGITMLVPVSSPAATFGFNELSNIGIKNQGAMNGDLEIQIYIGADNVLRRISAEGVEVLGYKSYMENLDNPIIIYDSEDKDFYIGDSKTTYLLTSQGLTEIPQHPSAVWRSGSEVFMLPDDVDDYYQTITTHPFDLSYAGQKTIAGIETDLTFGHRAEAAVGYYLNPTSYKMTPYKPLNNQGTVNLPASGNAFTFSLRYLPTYDNSKISYIKARFKMTDLRSIRGVYAPPLRGQSYDG